MSFFWVSNKYDEDDNILTKTKGDGILGLNWINKDVTDIIIELSNQFQLNDNAINSHKPFQ